MTTLQQAPTSAGTEPDRLPDGTPIRFRPITRADRDGVRSRFHQLSRRSRATRFLRQMPDVLSENLLETLVDDVDGVRHIAVVALVANEPIAVGHLVRSSTQTRTAELAVSVLDEWHRRGVAGLVTTKLLQQAPEIAKITALVDAENHASWALLATLGQVARRCEGGVCEAVVTLAPTSRFHLPLRRSA